ncbi:hypothetical protein HK105_207576 [Polyrhizophydium stewartii]|uniref:Uncharacterized protein n=1 Tax=Polyrhizophydium stewartii TaxID=2732419 RepID=A0ABR4N074_9FUNG|nr:hypothetical protein HK105_007764 [Polyrhizophydium stewartii]
MATKFVPPESAPLHVRLLSRKRTTLQHAVDAVEAFAASQPAAASTTTARSATSASAALPPSTAFQLSQLVAAIGWEQAARPARAPLLVGVKSRAGAGAGELSASTPASKTKKKAKKSGSKWA